MHLSKLDGGVSIRELVEDLVHVQSGLKLDVGYLAPFCPKVDYYKMGFFEQSIPVRLGANVHHYSHELEK